MNTDRIENINSGTPANKAGQTEPPTIKSENLPNTERINISLEGIDPNIASNEASPPSNNPNNLSYINIPVRRPLQADPTLVTISGSAGMAGVTLTYTGDGPTTADSSGNYTISVPLNRTGTVTPSKPGFTFVPASRNYTVPITANLTGENYTPSPIEYTLTITYAHGSVTKSPNQTTYHYGDVVHLTHSDSPGWTFDHWSNSSGTTIYPPGAVAISFDDGYLSDYTDVFPYMKSKGVPDTIYFICSWLNQSDFLSTAQLQEMNANGWSIGNHTVDHLDLDTLSETQQEDELLSCKNVLDGIGLTKASSHVAYLSGVWNTDTLTAMTNTGMLTGRTTDSLLFDPQNGYRLEIPSDSENTLAAVKQMTDDAVANHTIFFYHGHQIGQSGDLSLTDFKAWIDYLVLNQIPTLTVNDVYDRTFTPLDITITGNTAITANYIRSYTISGNAGIGGAVLTYGGGKVVADGRGHYTISVPSC